MTEAFNAAIDADPPLVNLARGLDRFTRTAYRRTRAVTVVVAEEAAPRWKAAEPTVKKVAKVTGKAVFTITDLVLLGGMFSN